MMLQMDEWCKGNMKKNPRKGDERGGRQYRSYMCVCLCVHIYSRTNKNVIVEQ
jgi:hypothetical protein